ncbi:MAG: hypothetical protein SFU98_22775 [Leptospiraceae bacterium]|nr:hypothetical protein [Leptospiraceae bacterium]
MISKFILFGFICFCLISANWREGELLSPKKVCPEFGELKLSSIPRTAIVTNRISRTKKLLLKNNFGDTILVPELFAFEAKSIRSKSEFEEFLSLYQSICGGIPNFKNQIAYLRNSLLRNKTLKNEFHLPVIGTVSEKKEIDSSHKEPDFLIMGKVISKKNRDLILLGSSTPNHSTKLNIPGFVSTGVILLKNSNPKDISGSRNPSDTDYVLADHLEYVGTMVTKKIFKERIPIHVFKHKQTNE